MKGKNAFQGKSSSNTLPFYPVLHTPSTIQLTIHRKKQFLLDPASAQSADFKVQKINNIRQNFAYLGCQ